MIRPTVHATAEKRFTLLENLYFKLETEMPSITASARPMWPDVDNWDLQRKEKS